MAAKNKETKWTAADIKSHTKNIEKIIEKEKKENKEENFISISPEEVQKKFKSVNSPFMTYESWGNTTPGGTFNYNVGVYNPDPTTATSVYLHVFVGSGNVDPVLGTFMLNVDTRFPRLTTPPFFGQTIAPAGSVTLTVSIKVPATVEKTVYLGNSCLMQINYFNVGVNLARACFPFTVS